MGTEFVQVDEQREPLLGWAPKWHEKWKINYAVPNFGADKDIDDSRVHAAAEENRLGHKWEPYEEEDEDGVKEWKRIPSVFSLNGRTN